MAEFDIYFRDLTPKAQEAFLEAAGLPDAKAGNYDVFAIATVELEAEKMEFKLYSPLSICVDTGESEQNYNSEYGDADYSNEDGYEQFSPYDAASYESEITAHFVKELTSDQDEIQRGLMAYYYENDGVAEKVRRIGVTTEVVAGQLMGVATVSVYEPLTPREMTALKEYLSGQYSDGYGEGAEQRPVKTDIGELYVSLWQSGKDFCIQTEQEMNTAKKHKNRGDAR